MIIWRKHEPFFVTFVVKKSDSFSICQENVPSKNTDFYNFLTKENVVYIFSLQLEHEPHTNHAPNRHENYTILTQFPLEKSNLYVNKKFTIKYLYYFYDI